ncbi:helix-turn-helix domain-containing protein [Pedobacter sp. Leaf176]|uniref:helix-turn-helix domain-containing protein n=1 Tax=Pedobacter sp. Leaf176 TaxID=1736286 RepID=UPI0006F34385|nr:helix-turn-helix domain-containing protein [Pedobacter sp. Leaf176]KQR66857.1 hypothetical protein ASF92_19075 [Pedobacter sp. Leaf176]
MQQPQHIKSNFQQDHPEIKNSTSLMVSNLDRNSPENCPTLPFRAPGFGILLVTKGTLQIKINFESHTFKFRDIICILPDHIYEIPQDPAATLLFTYFDKEYLVKKGLFFDISESFKIFNNGESMSFSLSKVEYELVIAHMLSLQSRLTIPRDTRYVDEMVHASFLSVVYDIFLLNEKQKKIPSGIIDSKIELTNRFLSILSENFKEQKKVTYYASRIRVTPRHLSKVVKQVTGRSAGQHIDDFVIREAKLLLTSHIMNISEIAIELGFSNGSFFGKFFKKQTNLTPGNFKKHNTVTV